MMNYCGCPYMKSYMESMKYQNPNLHMMHYCPMQNISMPNMLMPDMSMPNMPMQDIPMPNMPMQDMPMPNMPMQDMPMPNMPMQNMPMQNMPMQNMPMQNMPMQNMPIPNMPMPNMECNWQGMPMVPGLDQTEFEMGLEDSEQNYPEEQEIIEEEPSMMTAASSDPPPVLSDNEVVSSITLFKELTGYPNYGNPSGNADILYTGNRGVWTFDIPQNLGNVNRYNAVLLIRGVLDDHQNVSSNRYSATISVNGRVVHRGGLALEHGRPRDGMFDNWKLLTFNINNLRRNNRVIILNNSSTAPNDWIAFDWMELRLMRR